MKKRKKNEIKKIISTNEKKRDETAITFCNRLRDQSHSRTYQKLMEKPVTIYMLDHEERKKNKLEKK